MKILQNFTFIILLLISLIFISSCSNTNENYKPKNIDPRILQLTTEIEKTKKKFDIIRSLILSGTLFLSLTAITGITIHDYYQFLQHTKNTKDAAVETIYKGI
ncbi:conserved Plasmodium protein, unknown function [Plasmodium sp. DRC-Itaito]|uniref:Early transcribed membrane protein n=1 Tax=Plasmodium gaboni TaxID=647221 RepID=A0ABY1ULK0_9APIC|nr:conserved Plasmodium protein, unknown function [Plasmodium gaboni]SOV22395.1 conserved Plasmodium protein, unknown function [Plasmodium sp. DRC-Itaito]